MIKKNPFITGVSNAMRQFRCNKVQPSLEKCLSAACRNDQPLAVYADTCSLLHTDGEKLLQAVETIFPKFHMQLTIFSSVITELENVGQKDLKQRTASERLLRYLRMMEQNGTVRIVIGDNNHFSDANFIAAFVHQIRTTNILFISQDNALCDTVSKLRQFLSPCIRTDHKITVCTLKNGVMVEHHSTSSRPVRKEFFPAAEHGKKFKQPVVRFYSA